VDLISSGAKSEDFITIGDFIFGSTLVEDAPPKKSESIRVLARGMELRRSRAWNHGSSEHGITEGAFSLPTSIMLVKKSLDILLLPQFTEKYIKLLSTFKKLS
jgi:hypothetical protein